MTEGSHAIAGVGKMTDVIRVTSKRALKKKKKESIKERRHYTTCLLLNVY